MGKHPWRKQTSVRVGKTGPGCIWTVFRLLDYHPWQNVKRMLMFPYMKQKFRKKRAKCSLIKVINEQIKSRIVEEREEDTVTNYSVNASPSGTGASSRRMSIKARIKALLSDSVSKRRKVNSIQEHELLALKDVCTDLAAPTLLSLLRANPKLLTAINPVDESANLSRAVSVKHNELMEEYVGVFELFKVDQDAFHKILPDSPRKKHRLVKSGSFPSTNDPSRNSVTFGKTPLKLEHKLNEPWPIPNQQNYKLRKSRSQNIVRSSSLKESLDRCGPLIDATSNNKEIINKHLSRSFRLTNEKDFGILSSRHGCRSFREITYLSEIEDGVPQATIESAVHRITECDEAILVRLDSCKQLDYCLDCSQTLVASNSDHDCETHTGISSVAGIDMHSQPAETDNLEHCLIVEDSLTTYQSTFEDDEDVQSCGVHSIPFGNDEIDSNESLQYVKFVLEVIGFTTTYSQLGAQHTLDEPLDPALFEDVEIFYSLEPNPLSKEEIVMSSSERRILFDLLNEALLEVHENSYAFYPKPLTSSCVVHQPVRKVENRVVEQIWEFITEYLLWQPETDEDFDIVIVRELSRHKRGWSNLQRDTEVLATDLEDWIFDDLLGEFACCQVIV